jgi:hypothetical protein
MFSEADDASSAFRVAHGDASGDLRNVGSGALNNFHRHAIAWSRNSPLKVIAAIYRYSALLTQTAAFDEWRLDYEILMPFRSRLYSRWRDEYLELGLEAIATSVR